MATCQEKEEVASCSRYCDCHLFELRRDLTDSQLEQMLLTAERGGTGAESIRAWLLSSARLCENRVFGDRAGAKQDAQKENPARETRQKETRQKEKSAKGNRE